jgi:hypothetical protein
VIVLCQAKNEHRNPINMDIPLHADSKSIIAATPSGHLSLSGDRMVTEYGHHSVTRKA